MKRRKQVTNEDILNKIQGVEDKVEGLSSKVQGIEGKVQGVDQKVQGFDGKFQGIEDKIQGLGNKIQGVESKLQGRVDEVLDVLQGFIAHTGEEFGKVNQRLDSIDGRLTKVEQTIPTLVTRDYLDEKLADQMSDIMVLFRKSDRKFVTLVEILDGNEGIAHKDTKRILAMQPFAK